MNCVVFNADSVLGVSVLSIFDKNIKKMLHVFDLHDNQPSIINNAICFSLRKSHFYQEKRWHHQLIGEYFHSSVNC